jgi:serine/threonine-protein kinase HipA
MCGGRWRGKQVVSRAWIKESTAPSAASAEYAYQWWLFKHESNGRTFDVIHAKGYGGQMLYIVPELDMVLVITGKLLTLNPPNPGALAQELVKAVGGRYVLKPQTGTYPALPENEHVTTQLAKLVDIEVAPNGLVSLKDGTLAYIVHRFDRLPDGHKLRQEDFCQLAELPPKDKYDGGSAELCVKLIRKYADEPPVELLKLYRLLLFTWWTGNGDMHLKNFSLLTGEDGITLLTPAYDLVCTRLVIPDDQLALPLQGKKDNLRRGVWRRFAEYCALPEKVALRLLDKQASTLDDAIALIDRSFLPDDQKDAYKDLIVERTESIAE